MKIAIVQRRMDRLGGAERLVHDLAHGLAEKGHKVDFFTYKYDESFWGKIESQKYKVVFLKLSLIPRPLRILFMGLYFRFRFRRYDVINIHNTYVNHWIIPATVFNGSYPPVLWYCNEPRRETYYDLLEPDQAAVWRERVLQKYRIKWLGAIRIAWNAYSYRALDKLAVKKCTAVLANSHFSGRMIEKALGIKPIVCHAGIRAPQEKQACFYRQPYWLLVSRMVFHKNVDTVLKAVSNLAQRGVPLPRLVLAGKGQDLERIKGLARSLHLDDHVDFLGFVGERMLDSLYEHAEFFIYTPFREPFGLTLIEAMKYGVPVIGANEGGAVEIVDHELNGLLADPHDVSAVESAIERMASDIEGRRRMGAQAKRKTEEYYSLEKFVERFEKICQENV